MEARLRGEEARVRNISFRPISVSVVEGENVKRLSLEGFKEFQKTRAEVLFSLVVPSYNEEKRIRVMLDETLSVVFG